VAGCGAHLRCPVWDLRIALNTHGDGTHRFPKTAPSAGLFYVDCWICKARFCGADFAPHYDGCYGQASRHCGFRPSTLENKGECFLRVAGHCAQPIEPGKEVVCYPDDRLCCTVCCSDCVDYCDNDVYGDYVGDEVLCAQPRCKLCCHECYGCLRGGM
jgi:hypothetical protein